MSKMKPLLENWARYIMYTRDDEDGGGHGTGESAFGRDGGCGLEEPAYAREDELTAGPMTLPTGEEAGARSVAPPEIQQTVAPDKDVVGNFDDAYSLARERGQAKFKWQGKPYSTRREGESDTSWAQDLGISLWDLHSRTGKIDADGQSEDWFNSLEDAEEERRTQERRKAAEFYTNEMDHDDFGGYVNEQKKPKKRFLLRRPKK